MEQAAAMNRVGDLVNVFAHVGDTALFCFYILVLPAYPLGEVTVCSREQPVNNPIITR